MRFSVENNELNKALNIVSKAVSAKSTSSALQCVYFEAADGILTLKATDGELSIITSIEADISKTVCAVGRFANQILLKTSLAVSFSGTPP